MDQYVDEAPKALTELLDEGRQLAECGRYDEAIDDLRGAVDLFPDEAASHYSLSVACLMKLKGDMEHLELWEDLCEDEELLETAIFECESALERSPEMTAALNNLGILYAVRGWYHKACEQWDRSLELDPEQPTVRGDIELARERIS